jgi:hypothetical protein
MFNKIHVGVINLDEINPIFESNRILFPISVKVINTDKYHGDARSFGYPVDEGMCTEVIYDYVVSIMAEDTIALVNSVKDRSRMLKKPRLLDIYDVFDIGDEWKKGLNTAWLEEEIKEWLDEGLITESEIDEKRENDLNNYHCLCQEWKDAYDHATDKVHKIDRQKAKLISDFEGTKVYKYNGKYYFSNKYYDYGNTCLLDTEDVDIYLDAIKSYRANVSSINVMHTKVNENLQLLKSAIL